MKFLAEIQSIQLPDRPHSGSFAVFRLRPRSHGFNLQRFGAAQHASPANRLSPVRATPPFFGFASLFGEPTPSRYTRPPGPPGLWLTTSF